jgi:hypothetical protein
MGPSHWHAAAGPRPVPEGQTATEASFVLLRLQRKGAAVRSGEAASGSRQRAQGTMDSEDGDGTRERHVSKDRGGRNGGGAAGDEHHA